MKDAEIPSREDLSILSDGLSRIGQIESPGETRLEEGESARLKKAVESLYSFCTSIANSSNFWNFGLKDTTTDASIREVLGDYDHEITDGYSEQLYYYTLASLGPDSVEGKAVLEVGCGLGAGLNFLSRVAPGAQYTGLDICDAAVRKARARYGRRNLTFDCGDAENVPYNDARFDIIVNVESCHNYPDIASFLRECERVLKPGGRLLLVDFFSEHRHNAFLKMLDTACPGLRLDTVTDVSELVKAAIRERLKPNSFAMRHFRKEIGTNVAKKIILRQLYEVALGSEFLGHNTAPVYRAANSIFLPASKRFTGDRYVFHGVSRL